MLEHASQYDSSEIEAVLIDDVPPLFGKGAVCGKYRVLRLLAWGGMSQVFEAVHTELRKHVALKVLSPVLRSDREAHMRFAAEAINAAGLVHTNILDVVDCGVINGLPYLVTNLLIGCDLATHLSRHGKLPPADLVDILLPIAKAIAFGHRRGIMHRDLKPENIFLHKEGSRTVPKVLDFGVSRMLGAPRITANISVVGTPHYMAPEQARAEKSVGPAADQYAMGVILYEGLTGRLPRNEAGAHALLYSVAYGSFPPPSRYVQLPAELERIVLKAMAAEPSERFGSMDELAEALVPYATEPPQSRRSRQTSGSMLDRRYAGAAHASSNRALPAAAPVQVLDVPMLLNLLGARRGLMTAVLAGLVTLAASSLWLATQPPRAAPGLHAQPTAISAPPKDPS
jgi:eukaryotic-like serine/threonine-protein kinase